LIFDDHEILGLAHFIDVVAVRTALQVKHLGRIEAVIGSDERARIYRARIAPDFSEKVARNGAAEFEELVAVRSCKLAQAG